MEALRSSLRSVAGEVMGTGENGTREGHPLLSSARFAGHFVSLSNKFTDIMWQNPVLNWSDLEQNSEQHL